MVIGSDEVSCESVEPGRANTHPHALIWRAAPPTVLSPLTPPQLSQFTAIAPVRRPPPPPRPQICSTVPRLAGGSASANRKLPPPAYLSRFPPRMLEVAATRKRQSPIFFWHHEPIDRGRTCRRSPAGTETRAAAASRVRNPVIRRGDCPLFRPVCVCMYVLDPLPPLSPCLAPGWRLRMGRLRRAPSRGHRESVHTSSQREPAGSRDGDGTPRILSGLFVVSLSLSLSLGGAASPAVRRKMSASRSDV